VTFYVFSSCDAGCSESERKAAKLDKKSMSKVARLPFPSHCKFSTTALD